MIYAINVLSISDVDVTNLSPAHMKKLVCLLLHEQRILYRKETENCDMYSVDTDIVIPPITMYSQINPDELWIAFGSKLHFSYLYAYS